MGSPSDYMYTQNEYGWKYIPAQYSVDSSGNVTGLVGPSGTEYPVLKGSVFLTIASSFYLTGGGASNLFSWDTEEYDDLSAHSTVTNPSRITIPTGITRVRFRVGIDTQVAPSDSLLTYNLHKNGVFFAQIFQHTFLTGIYGVYTSDIPEIRCSPGDYFTIVVTTTAVNNFHGIVGSANRATYFAADFY